MLVDVGPNLGAINRAAIIAANHVVFPLAPDLFSLQGLQNIGPTLRDWRVQWQDRLDRRPPDSDLGLPDAQIVPTGYVVMQHAVRATRPVRAYQKWMRRIPPVYHRAILEADAPGVSSTEGDDERLATLKHHRSLLAMAREARKPAFSLRAADGAIGGHLRAVHDCHEDFAALATAIAERCDVVW